MSDDEIHVPHHAHRRERGLAQWIAIFTALVATFGAIVGHEASETANEAILYKNDAVLKKAEAANQWAYYQQVSTKALLTELAKTLAPEAGRADYDNRIAKYANQKNQIQARAEMLEQQVTTANTKSAALRTPRLNFTLAIMLLQIGISVASVTVLTGRAWLFGVAGLAAIGGVGFWVAALLAH